jgi:outer membrane protein assembly factor BamB
LRSRRLSIAATLAAPLLLSAVLPAAEWSRFRGPNGGGVVDASAMPVAFGPAQAAAWAVEVPFGRSSPILTDRHVFLTATAGDEMLTLAIDRATGRELWRRGTPRDYQADLHRATDSATPTPVTDGVNVYAFFHEAGLVSYDAIGNLRWRVPLGPLRNYYSVAASPILVGDVLVLLCDQARGSSFIVGLDKDTGEQLWRRERPARAEAYATPLVVGEGGSQVILALGSKWLDAYDPRTGASLWTFPGVGAGPISSPIVAGDMLFVAAPDQASDPLEPFASLVAAHDGDGDGRLARAELEGVWMFEHFAWLDGDGDGWLTETDWAALGSEITSNHWGISGLRLPGTGGSPETVWNTRQSVPYIPTLLLYEDVLYSVKGDILSTADPRTGELHARRRLGPGSGRVYASPVAADGKVYVSLVEGQIAVLEAGPAANLLALNDLGDEIYATPALADGELYVRTRGTLYRFRGEAPSSSGDGDEPGR